jgi:hypothetical protein
MGVPAPGESCPSDASTGCVTIPAVRDRDRDVVHIMRMSESDLSGGQRRIQNAHEFILEYDLMLGFLVDGNGCWRLHEDDQRCRNQTTERHLSSKSLGNLYGVVS